MDLEQARTNMVEQQIRTWEVLDQDVLDLLYVVPREEFVPTKQRALAFSDMQLPIGESERMWEPKLEAACCRSSSCTGPTACSRWVPAAAISRRCSRTVRRTCFRSRSGRRSPPSAVAISSATAPLTSRSR